MAGLGMGLGLAGGAAVDELHEIIAERLMQQQLEERVRAAKAEEQTRERQMEEQQRWRELQQEQLQEEREFRRGIAENQQQLAGQAATERSANAIVDDTPIGGALSGEQAETLRKGGRSNLVRVRPRSVVPGLQTKLGGGSATIEPPVTVDEGGNEFTGTAGHIQAAEAAKRAEAAAAIAERRIDDAERRTDLIASRPVGGASDSGGSVQQVVGADGTPSFVIVKKDGTVIPARMPEGVTPNRPSKPVTGAERQTLAYYNRAKEASDTLADGLETRIAGQSYAGQLRGEHAPNVAQTEDQRRYRQAQRAFTEARLRKESGAAIPDQEYQNDARTYFAQPGDSKTTIAQKQKARLRVLDGLKYASGRAYTEFYGDAGKKDTSSGRFSIREK